MSYTIPGSASNPLWFQIEINDLRPFLIPQKDKSLRNTQEASNLLSEHRDKFSASSLSFLFSLRY